LLQPRAQVCWIAAVPLALQVRRVFPTHTRLFGEHTTHCPFEHPDGHAVMMTVPDASHV